MEILLGLSAAILWGLGDFLTRAVTQRIGPYSSSFFIQLVGVIVLSIYLWITGDLQRALVTVHWSIWIWAVVAVILNVIGTVALHRAFVSGALIVVSPIASSYAAVTVILSILSGEVISFVHGSGIACVFFGVIFVSTPIAHLLSENKHKLHQAMSWKGILWAVVSACGYGSAFWILGFHVTPYLGGLIPVWLIRALTPIILLSSAPILREKIVLPPLKILLLAGIVDVFNTAGYLTYTFGLLTGQIATVTILSSLYSVVTVILAFLFLRDTLERSQWLGLIILFIGIVLVNI